MISRNWKRLRPNSLVHALRLCKDYALERHQLSVARIADRMGTSEDSLYKWLGTGRMPANLIPSFELACGCPHHYASIWFATSAGKLVIDLPKGHKVQESDLVKLNSGFAEALQLLQDFAAGTCDAQQTLQALQLHLEQAAWHHANVSAHATPELEFGDD